MRMTEARLVSAWLQSNLQVSCPGLTLMKERKLLNVFLEGLWIRVTEGLS